jgi:endonuclease YncB( thermonuclease family)
MKTFYGILCVLFCVANVLLYFNDADAAPKKDPGFIYEYPLVILRVMDGDSFVCNIDVTKDITLKKQKIRLLGCDAWEKRDPLGPQATQFAKDFLSTDTLTLVTTTKRDSFGRMLGNVRNGAGDYLKDGLTSAGLTTGRFVETDILN